MARRPTKALVVGSGAREHALAWALAQSRQVEEVMASPGNPGMGEVARLVPAMSPADLVAYARKEGALVVVGPEDPLAEGLADRLREEGLLVVGPGQRGAQLESSKRFAKEIMQALGVPTASATVLTSPQALAQAIESAPRWPMVVKQSGLAQGKGVRILFSPEEARALLEEWRPQRRWFEEGLLWEDFLSGRELSVEVFTNGREYVWLPPAVDHKRLTEDPASPNTGGMGAYAPVPWLDQATRAAIDRRVLQPVVGYLRERGIDYRGVLYAGLMITEEGPWVLEFNVRFGDPEAEAVLPLLADDLYEWLYALAAGEPLPPAVSCKPEVSVAVVVASQGYPSAPVVGRPIHISRRVDGTLIFHAGTERAGGELVSRGGRVLTVVATDRDFASARRRAYEQVQAIELEGGQFRADIAQFGAERPQVASPGQGA